MQGLWFEQFEAGSVITHDVRRTVTETDNVLFNALTLNLAAIHIDHEYCAGTEFGRPLVNSVFTLGLVISLTIPDTTLGTTVANMGMEQTVFPKPVFAGDTIRAETRILDKRPSKSRPGQGIVKMEHVGINQHGDVVCRTTRSALMLGQPGQAGQGLEP